MASQVRVGARESQRDHSWKPLTTSSRPDACTDPCSTLPRLRPPHVSLIDREMTAIHRAALRIIVTDRDGNSRYFSTSWRKERDGARFFSWANLWRIRCLRCVALCVSVATRRVDDNSRESGSNFRRWDTCHARSIAVELQFPGIFPRAIAARIYGPCSRYARWWKE